MLALLLTSLAMLSTLGGGYVAVAARRRLHILLGLGAGVLLGSVFFDLLPESLALAGAHGWSARTILGLTAFGFVGFYLLERLVLFHACPEGDCENEAHRHVGRIGAIGLIAHSVMDGASIGAATLVSWQTGLLVALAVVAHDSSDGLNTVLLATRGERAERADYVLLALDAVAPVAGGLTALAVRPSAAALAFFLALASGLFLYTATSDLLPEAHRRSPSLSVSAWTVVGIAVMGVAVLVLDG